MARCTYKYTAFIFEYLNELVSLAAPWYLPKVRLPLPLGISFFTFHVISYLVDVYRGTARPQQTLATFALYMLNFPQLIAGLIIRIGRSQTSSTSVRQRYPTLTRVLSNL